ncbi:Aldehyde oxidase/xanthine dehydrogenase like protein, partial [Aduncisulcus paluster]
MVEGVLLYINGKRHFITSVHPTMSLASYLKSIGLKGTKVSCGEGGCGSCTILLSHFDKFKGRIVHRAVVSCILPLIYCDGMAITTIEGMSTNPRQLHPIQQRIVAYHATQCGICTPGIVMALFAFLLNHPNAKVKEIEHCFDCNLCRCTGYRAILDAAKTFGSDYEGYLDDLKKTTHTELEDFVAHSVRPLTSVDYDKDQESASEGTVIKPSMTKRTPGQKFSLPQPFPKALMDYHYADKLFENPLFSSLPKTSNRLLFRPGTLPSLLQFLDTHEHCRIVSGMSEVLVDKKNRGTFPEICIPVGSLSEMRQMELRDVEVHGKTMPSLFVGGSITLSETSNRLLFRPGTLPSLLQFLDTHEHCRIVSGMSEVLVDKKNRGTFPEICIPVGSLSEMRQMELRDVEVHGKTMPSLFVGGSITLSEVCEVVDSIVDPEVSDSPSRSVEPPPSEEEERTLSTLSKVLYEYKSRNLSVESEPSTLAPLLALRRQLRLFASSQVREVATLTGNVSNASPISDTIPILMANHAIMNIYTKDSILGWTVKDVPLREFITGYRRTILTDNDFVAGISLPFAPKGTVVHEFKYARRLEDDISIVNGCVSLNCYKDESGHIRAKHAGIVFGGMAAHTKPQIALEEYLMSTILTAATLTKALSMLSSALVLPDCVLKAIAEGVGEAEAQEICQGLRIAGKKKRWAEMCGKESPTCEGAVKEEDDDIESFLASFLSESMTDRRLHSISKSTVRYDYSEDKGKPKTDPSKKSVNTTTTHGNKPHVSAERQVQGKAEYVSTMSQPSDTVIAIPVFTNHPHARIVSLDVSKALEVPGVVDVVTREDIQGVNAVGVAIQDEPVFIGVGDECQTVGQILAIICVDNKDAGIEALKEVKVEYEDLPVIATIEQAIEAKSWLFDPIDVTYGLDGCSEEESKDLNKKHE